MLLEIKKRFNYDAIVIENLIIKPSSHEVTIDGEKIEALFLEFDAHETPEAKFAYQCDKLECDIQCKLYDQEQCVDLTHQEGNNTVNDGTVKELLETGKSWSQMWLEFGQSRYPYDKNFLSVSNIQDTNTLKRLNGGFVMIKSKVPYLNPPIRPNKCFCIYKFRNVSV